MKLAFILSLITIYSCSQELRVSYATNNEDKVQFIDELGKEGYVLAPNNYVHFITENPDSKTGEWLKYLVYKGEEAKRIGQVDLSGGFYSDKLLLYKSSKTEKQIALWKQEDEYWSYLHFYLFEDGQLVKLSDIAIGQPCDECDSFNYPVEKIAITSYQDEIKIEFKGKSVFLGFETLDTPYHSKTLKPKN